MPWELTPISVVGFGAVAVYAVLVAVAWSHRDARCGYEVAVLHAIVGISALAYSVQLGFDSVSLQASWWRLSFVFSTAVPLLWLVFVARYVGQSRWMHRRHLGLLTVEPLVAGAGAITNHIHGLAWSVPSTTVPPGSAIEIAFGPLYYAHLTLTYTAVVVGVTLLLLVGVRRSLVYWKQAAFLAVAPIPPFVANIAFLLGSSPIPNIDLTPFVFTFTGVVVVYSLYWSDLLERTPIAQRQAFEAMGDGLVTLDSAGVVVDIDDTAARVLDPAPEVGRPIGETYPDRSLTDLDGTTVVDGTNLAYDIRVSELTDEHGDNVGYAMALRDITGRHRYQQRLEVANRVLRHNLRNDMNVVRGYAETVESGAPVDAERAAAAILDRTDDLLAVGEKAQKVSELDDSHRQAPTTHDMTELVAGIVHRTAREYPDVSLSVDGAAGAAANLTDSGSLGIAIREVIELLAAQADDEVAIQVAVERDDGEVTVRFGSSGPGIPAVERETLTAGSESPLQHADGLGMWLAYWCVIENGGDLCFETDTPSGDRTPGTGSTPSGDSERMWVVFRFPAPEE
jgi:signal transduction histidine kinase